jgi:uncharacterized membrane protein YphA (DoxX/SURF4 family)
MTPSPSRDAPAAAPPFDPGPQIRHLIVFLLRAGLGMSLLNAGLFGYLGRGRGGVAVLGGLPIPAPSEPVSELLPIAQIALGLALIFGLFTTVAALAAGLLFLLAPAVQMAVVLGTGFLGNPNSYAALHEMLGSGPTNGLLLVAAILWLSPVGSNPWSLDRLLFARLPGPAPGPPAPEPEPPAPATPKEPPAPAPPPGERVAKFMSNRGG